MLENSPLFDLINLSECMITDILHSLIKDRKYRTAVKVYLQAYDVDFGTAIKAVNEIRDSILKEGIK